ncbi:cation:proton antiporter [Candidatus Micrarchaeota archaeon]|nr:cation:proton antiporter [Candidatus Micrarchaeota archaeon]
MASGSTELFLVLAGLIFAGIISLLIFKRFKITDVLILMVLGVILGQGLHLVDAKYVEPYMAAIGSFTLAMVLFNEGLNLSYNELKELGPKVLTFSLVVYALTVALIGLIVYFIDPLHNLFQSLVIAIVLGAPGPAVVLPVLHGLTLNDKLKKFLVMEVIITDAIAILLVTAFLVLGIKDISEFTPEVVSRMINTAALSIFVGIVAGVLWVGILSYYREKFDYLLALGTMLLTYSIAAFLNSNGILAVFTLGLFIGNVKAVKLNELRLVHEEFTFLIKTFFFIYLGSLFNYSYLNISLILTAIAIIAPMLIARYAAVFIFRTGDAVSRPVTTLVIARGVAVAIMAILVSNAKLINFPYFLEITFIVIFITNLIATIGAYIYEKRVGYAQQIHVGATQLKPIESGKNTGL